MALCLFVEWRLAALPSGKEPRVHCIAFKSAPVGLVPRRKLGHAASE